MSAQPQWPTVDAQLPHHLVLRLIDMARELDDTAAALNQTDAACYDAARVMRKGATEIRAALFHVPDVPGETPAPVTLAGGA